MKYKYNDYNKDLCRMHVVQHDFDCMQVHVRVMYNGSSDAENIKFVLQFFISTAWYRCGTYAKELSVF